MKDQPADAQNISSNPISSASFEDAMDGKMAHDEKPITVPKGIIVMDSAATSDIFQKSGEQMPPPIPFESNASIKIEEIDFSKLSMIAGGGNDQRQELSQESIKEIV